MMSSSEMFSLNRWFQNYHRISYPTWVGGVISQRDSKIYLCGQNCEIQIEGLNTDTLHDGQSALILVSEKRRDFLIARDWKALPALKYDRPALMRAEKRCLFLKVIKDGFRHRGLLEVDSPSLYLANAGEPTIEPLRTQVIRGSTSETRLLVTSPELFHKRLLLKGFSDIFEVKTCYRNNEDSPVHDVEFLMLEWYRGFATLDLIYDDLSTLLNELHRSHFLNQPCLPFKKLTMADAFFQSCAIPLEPNWSLEEWKRVFRAKGISAPSSLEDAADAFNFVFVDKVEPWILALSEEPLLITQYPSTAAGLAQLDSNGWAERFEFYWRGLEIANGYNELINGEEQRRRFQADQKRIDWRVDFDFCQEVEALPPTAGCALGLDRLLMAVTRQSEIKEVRI